MDLEKTHRPERELAEREPAAQTGQRAESSPADNATAPGEARLWSELAAARGTSGSPQQLPHLARIQRSFGRHDVSSVRAHVGGPAASASRELGALAYAHGNSVAFANAPDLHTAAHEAAHVVQQQSGVARKAIDAGSGDAHEQHADAVADAVVRGDSAEALLSSGPSGGGLAAAVHRKGDADGQTDTSQLPDDKNFIVLTDGSVLLRNDWFFSAPDKTTTKEGDIGSPSRMTEILTALRAQLTWIDPAQIPDLATKIGIAGGIDPKAKFGRYQIAFSIYALIGPPPSSDVVVSKDGRGLDVIVRQSTIIPGPVDARKRVELSAKVRDSIITGLERFTGLGADAAIKNKVINGSLPWPVTVDPGLKGVFIPFNEHLMETLFGKKAWEGYLRKPEKEKGSGVLKGNEGGVEKPPQWLPKGRLDLTPKLAQYVTGAAVQVEVEWDLGVHPQAGSVLLPNHCDYEWSVKYNGKVVDSEGIAFLFDNRATSLTLKGEPGKYEVSVTATSEHFLTPDKKFRAQIVINAVDEKTADKTAFNATATGKDGPFTRDPKGNLHLKPGQKALTAEQEKESLALNEGAVDALLKKGDLTQTDHDVLMAELAKQRAAIEEVAKKTQGGTPYVVRGSFVSREDSTATPLKLLMHMMDRGAADGEGHYSVLLHDTTFGSVTQHPGSAKGPVAKDVTSAYQKLEVNALDDMAEHLHAHNDFPSGTVHLAAQQLTSGSVWETTRDTDNGRKTAKKILGGIAMVGGVALLVIPGGGFVSAAVFAVTATAGAASVGVEIEDRIAKEGELKFDRRLALDVLQVVSMALPFGTMTRVLAEAAPLAKAGYMLCMTSVDVAQGFMIAQDVRDQLRLIDANTALALTQATTEEERKQILSDRDRKVGQVVGGAMVNGTFIMISVGGGIKRLAAMTHAGITVQIREPVLNIKNMGRTAMEDALGKGWFQHENERVVLSDEERTFLEQEVTSLKSADKGGTEGGNKDPAANSGGGKDSGGAGGGGKDNGGGGGKDNGGGGGKDNGGGGGGGGKNNGGGKGGKPEVDAQTADDLKKYANAEQQHADLQAVESGTASKEQREHLAQELRRQVPDIALLDAVKTGNAKTVISVVTPGGGETGIKRMNDELISYQFNSNRLIPGRNRIIKEAFEAQGFKVVDQGYKTTTFVSDKAPADTTAGMDAAAKQIDANMKPLLEQVLDEATQHFKADVAKRTPPDPEIALGQGRIKKMADLRKQIAGNKNYHFDFQMGAAELKGGKDATYEDVLGSEMNATKAAIMARDTSFKPELGAAGGRAMVFHDGEFVSFAQETVAIKDKLVASKASLPYHGQRLPVFEGGTLNRDILRAVRKGSYNEKLNAADTQTLESVKQYFTRVNSLDYIKHFTGDEVAAQGQKAADTAALIKQLESDKPISKEAAEQIQATLSDGAPQADAGNEAQFYAKAASVHDRVVLNADIKDMGLDLFAGYEKSLDTVGRDPKANVNSVSQHASDAIVEFKRDAVSAFKKFYSSELLPKAKELARAQKRQDLLDILEKEPEPLLLLGGDEITVSLPKAFEELGLLPEAVAKLTSREVANARVAVTHTGNGAGAEGHVAAMKAGQGGQDMLKKEFEPLARELEAKASKLPADQGNQAVALADRINRMYTEERSGKTEVIDADGSVVDPQRITAQAKAILDMKDAAQ